MRYLKDLELMDKCLQDKSLYYVRRGPLAASHRLFLVAGTHGQEIAGPMALNKLLNLGKWQWPNVMMIAVWQDPTAYQEEGYGFVGVDGSRSCWPPLWGYHQNQERYWFYVDENSAWGNNVIVPEHHQKMRELMEELDPTFCLSLHETVRSEVWRDWFWSGADMLLIETWPISEQEMDDITCLGGRPLQNPLYWIALRLYDWIRPLLGFRRYQLISSKLESNRYYRTVSQTVAKYNRKGGKLTGDKWMSYLEENYPLSVGPGRLIHEPWHMMSEWKTVTDYAVGKYGAIGVTTETFPCGELGLRGVDDRVDSQFLYITSVLDVLNEDN